MGISCSVHYWWQVVGRDAESDVGLDQFCGSAVLRFCGSVVLWFCVNSNFTCYESGFQILGCHMTTLDFPPASSATASSVTAHSSATRSVCWSCV